MIQIVKRSQEANGKQWEKHEHWRQGQLGICLDLQAELFRLHLYKV